MLVSVHVHPRASRARSEWKDGRLEVWITEPPVEGRGNRAVLESVARHFGVPVSSVVLRSGGRGRSKLVEVRGSATSA